MHHKAVLQQAGLVQGQARCLVARSCALQAAPPAQMAIGKAAKHSELKEGEARSKMMIEDEDSMRTAASKASAKSHASLGSATAAGARPDLSQGLIQPAEPRQSGLWDFCELSRSIDCALLTCSMHARLSFKCLLLNDLLNFPNTRDGEV